MRLILSHIYLPLNRTVRSQSKRYHLIPGMQAGMNVAKASTEHANTIIIAVVLCKIPQKTLK